MNIQRYAKRDIALGQIETALRLYAAQGDLFSVITLAGAAEELLGELLRGRGDGLFKPLFQILRPATMKTEGAEPAVYGETDTFVHTDPRQEAVFLLGRAIDDYRKLCGTLTPAMENFNRQARGEGANS